MNLYYELLQYPVFSMKEVNALYSSERTARAALEKLLKENMVLKILKQIIHVCQRGKWRTGSEQISDCQCYHTIFLCIPPYCL